MKSFFFGILKFIKWCLYLGLFFTLIGIGVGAGLYFHIAKDLPKLDKIEDYRPPVMSEVYDDSGKKIGEFWTEARILTPIDQVPKLLMKAFVSAEDERFFEHKGVDPVGILRATINNLKSGQKQGASTITQQVTKALLLSPERTYERKIKEAILATRIEKNLNKDQILYIYLNQIYFGNRAYGIATAARNYFHKELKDLNLAEMAMIAGLAKGPSTFNPIVNPARAQERMNYVLNRMVIQNYITAAQAEEAKNTPLQVFRAGTDKEFNFKYAPFFVEEVRRQLLEKYGVDKLYTGGWKIYTTVNLDMYKNGQQAVISGTEKFSRVFGYRGPEQHLDSAEKMNEFFEASHLRFAEEKDQFNYYADEATKNQERHQLTPIDAGRIYDAVITAAGSDLTVRIGNSEGKIANKDWIWAKQPAAKMKPWTPSVGDVVEVKLKVAEAKTDAKDKEKTPGSDALTATVLTTAQNFTLYQSPEVESALYSYEPFTGAIKAIIGGKNYEKSEFNRATQALLQPGSSIKPLIYAAALDKGYTPGTIINDAPISYNEGNGKFWEPKNYGGKYYGPTALRNALINSRNVVTVRILMDIGTHYVTGFFRKMGLTTPVYKFYSMALGSNEIKLAELARAYGAFVNGGILPETHMVSKITDFKDKLVEEYQPPATKFLVAYQNMGDPKEKTAKPPAAGAPATGHKKPIKTEDIAYNQKLYDDQQKKIADDELNLTDAEKKLLYGNYIPEGYVISPNTAVTMISILRDVVRAGTGTGALALQKPAGGKTGTTNNATDAWFIGFTPNLVTGVWVGFDETRKSLGHGATGGGTAVPIWLAYMKEATKSYATQDFTMPSWVDVSIYEAPILAEAKGDGVDPEAGGEGVGTGVKASAAGPSGAGSNSADFFINDMN